MDDMSIISTFPQDRYIAPVLDTKRFHFSSNQFVAEVSELPKRAWGQLYNDAADAGLLLENRSTGYQVPFFLKGTDIQAEDEVMGWRFEVCPEAVRKNADLAGLTILIIND